MLFEVAFDPAKMESSLIILTVNTWLQAQTTHLASHILKWEDSFLLLMHFIRVLDVLSADRLEALPVGLRVLQ